MGILEFFRVNWIPREGVNYRSGVYGRQWVELEEGTRGRFDLGRVQVYIRTGGKTFKGGLMVRRGLCTLEVVKDKNQHEFYQTPVENMRFEKKYIGTVNSFGHNSIKYQYVGAVISPAGLIRIQPRTIVRRRGTAIVDGEKGILVVAHYRRWLLPGGGARKGETRRDAVIRELREETGLRAQSCEFLFRYDEPEDSRGVRNRHMVFFVKATGSPRPNHRDVNYLAYWNPGSDLGITQGTRAIIEKYLKHFKHAPS